MIIKNTYEQCGFQLVHENADFKCAFITHDTQYMEGKITTIKRHRESDEVFTLIEGQAVLLTRDSEDGENIYTELKKGMSYCVTAGTWHYLAVSKDALLFVAENSGVSNENSDELSVEKESLYISLNI